jgi:hypothetical protein
MSPKVGDYIFNTIDMGTTLVGRFTVLVLLVLEVQYFHPLPWGLYLLWTDLYYLGGVYVALLIIRIILRHRLPTEDEEDQEETASF